MTGVGVLCVQAGWAIRKLNNLVPEGASAPMLVRYADTPEDKMVHALFLFLFFSFSFLSLVPPASGARESKPA